MTRITPRAVRAARINHFNEPFNLTAAHLGIHPADVHRAVKTEALDADERQTLVNGFLRGEKVTDLAAVNGVTSACVMSTVRTAFIHEKVERGILRLTRFDGKRSIFGV
ncbi:hypothetical protein [Paraburkholderia sp. 40]|uniref:hypothetical protein n=1 Tax=Paraburkholderia sp. 40 TaxID=2991059 RepID=UPI003D1FB39E